ncbi:MAG: flippase-like domain-containing protein [Acidimicrobiia bacterium]|nr:flippase-like domain-containing protein [Acidimicrobiia bacterium]
MLRGLSTEEATDAFAVVSHELHRKSPRRRVVEAVLSVSVIVVIFAFVIPRLTGSDYRDVWDRITSLDASEIALLLLLWIVGMYTYTGVLTNTLPGLLHRQALVVNFAGSAVSNVMPFGGAVGVGATYAIDMSWGYTPPAVTISILVSGVWNVFAKLGMPVLALVMITFTGEQTGRLVIPTLLGLAVLIGAIIVLTMILRSEQLAVRVGGIGQQVVSRLWSLLRRPRSPDVLRTVLDFRHESIGLVRRRWLRLTLWIIVYNAMQYLLLLACVRVMHVDEVGWAEVFAAFAFARLLETIPLTPSGVGFVEAGAASALIAFGGDEASATAAVFLFRGFVYLLEIPLGAAAWVLWASLRSWRRPVGSAGT